MAETDRGTATIAYEGPEGTVETTVENEHIVYFQDHWLVRADDETGGPDTVRRIPAERVYYVERSIEALEGEMGGLREQIESLTADVRRKLLGDRTGERDGASGGHSIEVRAESPDDDHE